MSYETTVGRHRPSDAGRSVYVCPLDDCTWTSLPMDDGPPKIADAVIRHHLERHDVAEWARTLSHWHDRAIYAERRVATLTMEPGEPTGCDGGPVWSPTPRGAAVCCAAHRDEHGRWVRERTERVTDPPTDRNAERADG